MSDLGIFALGLAPVFVGGFVFAWRVLDLREAFVVMGLTLSVVVAATVWAFLVVGVFV